MLGTDSAPPQEFVSAPTGITALIVRWFALGVQQPHAVERGNVPQGFAPVATDTSVPTAPLSALDHKMYHAVTMAFVPQQEIVDAMQTLRLGFGQGVTAPPAAHSMEGPVAQFSALWKEELFRMGSVCAVRRSLELTAACSAHLDSVASSGQGLFAPDTVSAAP